MGYHGYEMRLTAILQLSGNLLVYGVFSRHGDLCALGHGHPFFIGYMFRVHLCSLSQNRTADRGFLMFPDLRSKVTCRASV